jgi:hypothetical protein
MNSSTHPQHPFGLSLSKPLSSRRPFDKLRANGGGTFALTACCLLAATAPARANDFPTVDRVLYVQECIRNNPGPHYEMINKCSCALDRLAGEVKFVDYVNMNTMVNAVSIGGERGGQLRDNETVKPQIARYRELQAKVRKACFIGPQ